MRPLKAEIPLLNLLTSIHIPPQFIWQTTPWCIAEGEDSYNCLEDINKSNSLYELANEYRSFVVSVTINSLNILHIFKSHCAFPCHPLLPFI